MEMYKSSSFRAITVSKWNGCDLLDIRIKEEVKVNTKDVSIGKWTDIENRKIRQRGDTNRTPRK